jgi:hypothetical protein
MKISELQIYVDMLADLDPNAKVCIGSSRDGHEYAISVKHAKVVRFPSSVANGGDVFQLVIS